MASILSRLLTSDKPWSCPYGTTSGTRSLYPYSYLTYAQPVPTSTVQLPSSTTKTVHIPVSASNSRKSTQVHANDGRRNKSGYSTVRFGRVPKREKAKILAAMQKVNASSHEKALGAELEDELKLLSSIIRAHEETCDYTKDKVQILIAKAREQPAFAQCPPQLACPLNSAHHIIAGGSHYMEEFSERFTPAIQGVVEFAKRIPGFSFLSQDDQLTLLKAGVFEVLLVRLACMFDSQANTLISLNGQVMRRETLHSASNARFLLDSMFDFAERLNQLHLTDSEVGLFGAVVVIAADRPGLRNTDLVLKIQKKMMEILQKAVIANHPENPNIFGDLMKKIPDLRTLNTLHSEKLLAYKMEPKNQNGSTSAAATIIGCAPGDSNITSIYTAIPHEIWNQYSLVSDHHQILASPEDELRSTSPGQHSGSSTTSSEWSTTDSKDEHDLIDSPTSVSGLCIDDAKSPIRTSSFSSSRNYVSEDMWPAEMHTNGEYHGFTKRPREGNGSENGSSSGDEGYYVDSPVKGPVYPKLRRVDSPTDSGIESGKEHGPSTTPTICSSPHSTVEEKVKDVIECENVEKHETIDDMPVLKRALQAPPLLNTTLLMDEAYRHHKKFRAARRDVESPSSPAGISLASTHSTLVRTLEQAPRYLSEQQLKRTDLIHNIIMRTETVPTQQHQQRASPLHPHQSSHLQTHQEHSAQPNGTSGIHVAANGSYPFTSVPNPTPVPQNFNNNNVQHQQQKNLLVCPNGYYIPHRNSPPVYSASTASWQQITSGQSSHTTMSSPATVSSSPIHVHTQFSSAVDGEHNHTQPQQQNCPVNHQQSQLHHSSSATSSPRLIYAARSPAAPSSPLVINSGLASSLSPTTICQMMDSRLSPHSPPLQESHSDSVDTQPLNLSKKIFTRPMLKMES